MPLQRRHLRIPAAIALVALAVFVVLWIGARTELARGMVARAITDSIGLPATIESLQLGFFPSPSADIGGLAIAQPPGFGDEPFLTVGRLRLSLPWGRLFSRNTLNSVDITEATARLVVGADGVANWSKIGGASSKTSSPTAEAKADWLIRALELERGMIDYRDLGSNAHWQLAGIGLTVQDLAPASEFPLDLRLGGVFGSNTIHYAMKGRGRLDPDAGKYEATALDIRGWAGGDPLPLAGVELTGALERATYRERHRQGEAGRRALQARGHPRDFRRRARLRRAGARREPAREDRALRAARARGQFRPRAARDHRSGGLRIAAGRVRGAAARMANSRSILSPAGSTTRTSRGASCRPGASCGRASTRIDLNRYVPPTAKTLHKKKATLEAVVAELATYDLDAEIRIGEARIAGVNVRDMVIRVERDGEHTP